MGLDGLAAAPSLLGRRWPTVLEDRVAPDAEDGDSCAPVIGLPEPGLTMPFGACVGASPGMCPGVTPPDCETSRMLSIRDPLHTVEHYYFFSFTLK